MGAPGAVLKLLAPLLVVLLVARPVVAQAVEPPPDVEPDWSELVRGDAASGMVALTFDAGSVSGRADLILDALRDRGLSVTVFVTGRWVERYPDLAGRLVCEGHEVGNHSYDHPHLTRLGDDLVRWQLEHTEEIVQATLGRSTRPWFRPPFGARDARVLRLAADLGFRSVYWTLDSGDWRRGATAAGVLRRVLTNVRAGDIVVHHLGATATAEALPALLDGLTERGLEVVTVSELTGLRPEWAPDGGRFCPGGRGDGFCPGEPTD